MANVDCVTSFGRQRSLVVISRDDMTVRPAIGADVRRVSHFREANPSKSASEGGDSDGVQPGRSCAVHTGGQDIQKRTGGIQRVQGRPPQVRYTVRDEQTNVEEQIEDRQIERAL